MKQLKRITVSAIFMVLVGMGAAISLKAAIGVGAWDALAQSFSYFTGIKVGTVGMIFNSSCVLGQIILLRRNFRWIQLLQLPISIILGTIINFILYDALGTITIDSYFVNLLVLIAAMILVSMSVGAVMVLDVVTFALEGFCMAISTKIKPSFAKIRQGADVLSIVIILALTFAFSLPPSLREGTIINMLFFAPLMGFFMEKWRPLFKKLDLLATEPLVQTEPSHNEQLEVI